MTSSVVRCYQCGILVKLNDLINDKHRCKFTIKPVEDNDVKTVLSV